jgi:AcrR family transcriptional regulator
LAEPKRRVSKEERRRRLLAAAADLFGTEGYRKTEVEALARKAGVTKPMLYRHFPGGKAEIFMAVLDAHINTLLRSLWEAMGSSSDPRKRLQYGLRAYLIFAEENTAGFHLLVHSSPELDPGVGDRLHEVRESIARGLSTAIADVMKGAGLHAEGAPLYAHAMLGGVESVTSWWLAEGKTPDRERIVDHLLAFLWRGFDGLPRDPTKFHRDQEKPGLGA